MIDVFDDKGPITILILKILNLVFKRLTNKWNGCSKYGQTIKDCRLSYVS